MSNFVIINGFDRSGSSAISRTLTTHPETELIMQPFNSGFIRRKMYEVFEDVNVNEQKYAHQFFSKLEKNELDESLIKSQWHFKYSTTRQFNKGKIHVIKTTLNHFVQRWMRNNYPSIDVWGIWREPLDIVSSIIRNGFYNKWYSEGLKEIYPTVRKEPFLNKNYVKFFETIQGENQEVGLLLAIRTHFFLENLSSDKLLNFEDFKYDANEALKKIQSVYNLKDFDFNKVSKQDLNIIGKPFKRNMKNREILCKEDLKVFEKMFLPIRRLMEKFS